MACWPSSNSLPRWCEPPTRAVSPPCWNKPAQQPKSRADGLVVRGMSIDEIGERAFTNGVAVHELSPHAGSLEELFLDWTSDPSTIKEVSQL